MLARSLASLALAGALVAQESRPLARVDFGRDVRPILSDKCFTCHGPDANKRKANLRLDIADGDLATESGMRAIVAGKPDESELVRRVSLRSGRDRMPARSSGKTLTDEQIEVLRGWVAAGAPRAPHWAFVPPARPDVPANGEPSPIDAFVRARLAEEGLAPAPEADRATLLRRLTLDLTGLPPTPEELDAYAGDARPDAWERQIERLFASPRYGEHMARQWLDGARYADTHGFHFDNVRTMWPYRDWVIRAFAQNMRFDRFTIEQLAGDLLPDATREQKIASGFNRCNPTTNEGGIIDEEYLVTYAVDRVATTSTVWMGLTVGCARCHDHKFDPVSQKDFYRLLAFFNNVEDTAFDGNALYSGPVVEVPTAEQEAERAKLRAQLARASERFDAPDAALDKAQAEFETHAKERLENLWKPLAPRSALSRGGASIAIERGGTFAVSGAAPARDVYEVVLTTDATVIQALRIEALLDEKRGLVGRSENGNIVLTGVQVEVARLGEPLATTPVEIVSATADHQQRTFPAAHVLDGDPKTGWAMLEEPRQEHELVLAPRAPFGFAGGTLVRVRLAFESQYARHALARFRVACTTDARARPAELSAWSSSGALAVASQKAAFADELGLAKARAVRTWSPRDAFADGRVEKLASEGPCVTWLARTITSGSERMLRLALGSDDGIVAYWNGERVLTRDVERPAAPDQELLSVRANAGRNELLLAIVNGGGEHAFYFRVIGEATGPVPLAIERALQVECAQMTPQQALANERMRRAYYRREHSEEMRALERETQRVNEQLAALDKQITRTMVMAERIQRRPAHVLTRGLYDHKGEQVTRAVPALFTPLQSADPSRLDLARWLVDGRHPLTARVLVNRLWSQIFGIGIVRTVEDFGYQGEWPSHRELLDWLACELVDSGWDVQHALRLILRSSTYRQASRCDEATRRRDPENRLLARGPRARLDAEVLRDQALFTSGLLVERVGGPGVKPYQPAQLWKAVAYVGSNTGDYMQDRGDALWRRSLYLFWKRTAPHAAMSIFDAPDRESCVVRRSRTNTPLQALALLNDPQLVEAARAFAQRALQAPAEGDAARLELAFRRVTARVPEDDERAILLDTLADQRARFADPARARELLAVGEAPLASDLEPRELAAWTAVAQLLLNLDATVSKR